MEMEGQNRQKGREEGWKKVERKGIGGWWAGG